MNMLVNKLLIILFSILLASCASIIADKSQTVTVDTGDVEGATCELTNSKGRYIVKTPGSVVVDQSCSDLYVTCKKEGYTSVSDSIKYGHKGSAAGNIILGGGIGYLVDRGTGAACKYPNYMSLTLNPSNNNSNNNNNSESQRSNQVDADDGKLYDIGVGTGFFVNNAGTFVTNSHVLNGYPCAEHTVRFADDNLLYPINIITSDENNDLLIGKVVGKKNNSYLSLSTEINLGEDILVGGYPLSNKINSSTIKITKGIVSSMSGKDNNYSEFQLDATVQPGNSGGPIINEYGNLVGVTSYMLTNAQNTNFAKKSDTLKMLMDSNKISYFENKNKNKIDTVELSSKLNDATLQIFCANTESNWTKLINQNKVSTEAASFLK